MQYSGFKGKRYFRMLNTAAQLLKTAASFTELLFTISGWSWQKTY